MVVSCAKVFFFRLCVICVKLSSTMIQRHIDIWMIKITLGVVTFINITFKPSLKPLRSLRCAKRSKTPRHGSCRREQSRKLWLTALQRLKWERWQLGYFETLQWHSLISCLFTHCVPKSGTSKGTLNGFTPSQLFTQKWRKGGQGPLILSMIWSLKKVYYVTLTYVKGSILDHTSGRAISFSQNNVSTRHSLILRLMLRMVVVGLF